MVSNATTSRETIADPTNLCTLKKLGFEEENGQLREWITVARVSPAWALKVEYKL
jgi:hypothetical protein